MKGVVILSVLYLKSRTVVTIGLKGAVNPREGVPMAKELAMVESNDN